MLVYPVPKTVGKLMNFGAMLCCSLTVEMTSR